MRLLPTVKIGLMAALNCLELQAPARIFGKGKADPSFSGKGTWQPLTISNIYKDAAGRRLWASWRTTGSC